MSADILSLAAHRRKKQEQEVRKDLGISEAERAMAQALIDDTDYDQFIFNQRMLELSGPKDPDLFPMHPWTFEE